MFVPQVFHILLPFAVRYPTVAWGGLLAPSPGKLLMAAFILWRKRGKSWRKDFSSSTLSSAQSRPQDRFLSRSQVLLGMSLDKTHFLDIGSLDVPGFAGKQSSVPTWFLWVHTRSKALSILVPWHFGVCALSCGPRCRGSVHLEEFRTEMYERPVLFSLCGVWMYPSLSPVGWLLSLSTDLCWLLIYNFGPSLLSHVYTVHMWKLFQWFVMGNIVSASISPNQYASNNTTEMSGRKLAPGKISNDWTKSKASSGLTIPKWYLWSCRMLGCSPVY